MTNKSYRMYYIPLPIYNTEIEVIISNDFETAYKECGLPLPDTEMEKEYGAFLQRYSCSNGAPGYALFVPPNISYGTMAHEMFHVTAHVLADRKIKFKVNNHEAHAYTIGYLVDQLVLALKMYRVDEKAEKQNPKKN